MELNNLINQSQFQKYASALADQGLSDSSIRRKLSALTTFHKFLAKKKLVTKPLSRISSPITIANPVSTITPPTPNRLKSFFFNRYFIVASVLLLLSGLGYTLYTQVFNRANTNLAYSSASSPVTPNRILSFQGRLTDSSGNPITSSTGVTFKLFTLGSGGTELYNSGAGNSQTVIPDENGIFSVVIGQSHGLGIASSVFSENAEVWLEITAGGETMNPRQQIATVGYALNSESLQGLPPSASGMRNTVLVIDGSGNLNLGETSPTIISQSGTLGIIGQAILIGSSDGSGGNITINPDGAGKLRILTEGTGSTATGGLIEATNANLASGNLYSAYINNDNRGYNFIDFSNYNIGTTALSSRFSVDAYGNLASAGTINTSIGITTPRITISVGATSGYILQTDAFGNASWVNPGSAGIGTSYDAGNGLTKVGSLFKFGGAITENTRLNIGNTEVLYVDYTTGKIGIGTTNPTGSLTVTGVAAISQSIWLPRTTSSPTTGSGGVIYSDMNGLGGADSTVIGGESIQFRNHTDNTTFMTINTIGNLGLGTTAPGYKLHVNGDALISTRLGIGATHPLYAFNVGGTSMLTDIFSYGSLGLGTTAPTYKLELVGSNSIFRIGDTAGNTLVDISETSAQFNLPTTFTSTGDVNMANDLNFTNQTASTIRSNAPLYLEAGESFENNDLTLKTYGLGNIVFDSPGLTLLQAQNWTLATGTTNALNVSNGLISLDTLNSRVGIGTSSPTKKLDVAGDINLTGTIFTTGTSGTSGQVLTSTGTGLQWVNSASVGGTYVFTNGLTNSAGTVGLGGTLTSSTLINTGANSLSFLGLGNSQSLFVGASGYVGIGTTNPTSALQLQTTNGGGIVTASYSGTTGDTVGNYFRVANAYSNNVKAGILFERKGSNGVGTLHFATNSVDSTANVSLADSRLAILSSGNIGIGTTNPSKKLDVAGDINLTGTIFSNGTSGTSGQVLTSTGTGLQWVNSASVGGTYTFTNGLNNTAGTVGLGGTLTQNATINTSSFSLNIGQGNTQALYISSGGNVGIGTTNPANKVDIVGGDLRVQASEGTNRLLLTGTGDGSGAELYLYSSDGGLATRLTGDGGGTNYIRYGNVGIGTTSPSKKLDVAGDINLTGTIFTTGTSGTSGQVLTSTGAGLAWVNNVGTTYTFQNGINLSGSNVGLGGTLTSDTIINTGANSLSFLGLGNSQSLFVGTSGYVGIGTTNPTYNLQVVGTIQASTRLRSEGDIMINNTGSASAPSLMLGWTNNGIYSTGATSVGIAAGGIEQIRFVGGNVGIGTTAPSKKLDVAGDINLTGTIFSSGVSGTSGQILTSTGTGLQWVNAASVGGTYVFTNGLTNTAGTVGLGGTLTSNTQIGTSSFNLSLGINTTSPTLYLSPTGNIGLGTSNPETQLQLSSSTPIISLKYSTGQLGASDTTLGQISFGAIETTAGQDGNAYNAAIIKSTSDGYGWASATTPAALSFFTTGAGTTTPLERLRINSSGNVGIGTTSPTQKLDINGSVNIGGSLAIGSTYLVTNLNADYLDGQHGSYYLSVGQTGSFLTNITAGVGISISGTGVGRTVATIQDIAVTANPTFAKLGLGSTHALYLLNVGGTANFTNLFASGNVGIGTTNPARELSIYGTDGDTRARVTETTAGGVGVFEFYNNSGLAGAFFQAGSTWNQYGGSNSFNMFNIQNAPLALGTNNLARITILGGGDVGIGTSAPSKKLDVAGDVNLTGTIFSNGTSGTSGQVLTSTGTGLQWVNAASVGGTYVFTNGLTNTAGTVGLGGTLTQNTALTIGNTNVLYINYATGNIGVGDTSTATSRLRVAGNLTATGDITTSGSFISYGAATLVGNNSLLLQSSGDSFLNGGNVGIGTTSPTQKLDINGSVNIGGSLAIGSTYLVTNLNADYLDGQHGSYYLSVGQTGSFLTNITAGVGISISGTGVGRTIAVDYDSANLSLNGNKLNTIQPIATTAQPTFARLGLGSTSALYLLNVGGTANFTNLFASGNVGIGTTAPSKKLDVAGDINLTGTIFSSGVSGTSGQILTSTGTGLQWVNAASVGGTYVFTNGLTNTAGTVGLGGTLTSNTIINTGANSLSFRGLGNTQSLFIGASGFVGIGTTNPTAKLQLNIGDSGLVGQIIKAAAGQTSSLTQWQDSSGNTVARIDKAGGMFIDNTYTNEYTTMNFGLRVNPTFLATGDTISEIQRGIQGYAYADGNQNISASFRGAEFSAYAKSSYTGNIDSAIGSASSVGTLGNGTITNATAIKASPYSTGTGLITNYKGVDLTQWASTNIVNSYAIDIASEIGTTGSNKYALRIGNVSGATTNYAIYTNNGAIRFGDNLTIGGSGTILSVGSTALSTNLNADYLDGLHSSSFLQTGATGSFITTATNGLQKIGSTAVGLGGTLTQNTLINTGSNSLSFLGLGNTQGLFIGASGYVGIGTTNPELKLHVNQNAGGGSAYFKVSSVDNANYILFGATSGETRLYSRKSDNSAEVFSITQGAAKNFYLDATGNLGVGYSSNLSGKLLVNGNVGIGTTSPSKKLDIVGDINLTGTIFTTGTSGTSGQVLTSTGTGLAWVNNVGTTYTFTNGLNLSGSNVGLGGTLTSSTLINTGANSLSFLGLGNTQGLFIGASGYVGIGTTNPSKKLDIAGDINLTGTIFSSGTSGTSGQILSSTGTGLQWVNAASVGGTYVFSNGLTNNGTFVGLGGTLTQNTIISSSSSYLSFTGNSALSIGTTNPARQFVIGKTDSSNADMLFQNSTTGYTATDGFYLGIDASEIASLWNYENTALAFATNGTEYVRLSNTGLLGIGTTSPSQKLDVNGSVNIGGSLAIGSTYLVTNLNADYLDGLHSSSFLQTGATGSFITTATNGLQKIGSTAVGLGGTLTQNTLINTGSNSLSFLGLGNTQGLFIGASGYVGIGTTNPIGPFQVSIGGTRPITVEVNGNVYFGVGIGNGAYLGNGGMFSGNESGLYDAGGDLPLAVFDTTSGLARYGNNGLLSIGDYSVGIGTTSAVGLFQINVGNTSALFVSTTGNIGMGTTSPRGILDVTNPNNKDIYLDNGSGFTYIGDYSNAFNNTYLRVNGSDENFLFHTGNILVDIGNIGVGTTNPSKKLDIAGDIKLSGSFFVGAGVTGTSGQVLSSDGAGSLAWITPSSTTYTSGNGITLVGSVFGLGGSLTQNTTIGTSSFLLNIDGTITAEKFASFTDPTNYFIDPSNSTSTNASASFHGNGSILFNTFTLGSTQVTITANASSRLKSFANGFSIATNIGSTGIGATINWNDSLFVANNGYVGVGTTNPSSQLEIGGASSIISNTSGDITINSASNNISFSGDNLTNITNGYFAGNVGIGTTNPTGPLHINIGNTQALYVSSSGYVGIGTTDPTAELEIYKANDISNISLTSGKTSGLIGAVVGYGQNSSAASTYFSGIYNGITSNTAGSESGYLSFYTRNSGSWIKNVRISSAGYLGIGTTNPTGPLHINIGNTKALFVSTSGDVGIGTTNPTSKLHIDATDSDRTYGVTISKSNSGPSGDFGLVINNTPNTGGTLSVATTHYGLYSGAYYNIPSTTGAYTISYRGVNAIAQNNSNSYATNTIGVYALSQGTTNSTTASSYGIYGYSLASDNSTITNSYGVYGYANAAATATVTNAYGLYADIAGTPVTNGYGAYLGNITGTNQWGLYQSGTDDLNYFGGSVGIGLSSPTYALHVLGSNTSGAALFDNTATGITTPTVIVQTSYTGLGTTGAEFIRFLNNAGTKAGRIRFATNQTTLVYATTGAGDLAEYVIASEPTAEGDLISFSDNKFARSTPDKPLAGIHSSYATFVGNEQNADKPNAFPLAIAGIVKLKVNSQNGSINPGDPLTASTITGVAAKADRPGYIAARALESYANTDPSHTGVIEVVAGLNWYDPDIMLTDSGEINVNHNISDEVLISLGYTASKNEIESAQYSLNDSLGRPITRLAQFAQISSAKIKAGLVSTTNLIAKNIIAETTKSKEVKTAVLTPLSDISDTIVVQGKLAATDIQTTSVTTDNLTATDATISTLYAENIFSKEGNFGQLMTDKITALREEIRNTIASIGVTETISTPSALVADVPTWTFNTGTSQTEITGDVALSDNMVIGSKLSVLGDTQLGNAFVTGTFTAGEIAIKENFIETTASMLHIQPSGLGSVHIMNDTLIIAENGEVTVNGNLAVSGHINTTSLFANLINSDEITTKKLTSEAIHIATESGSPARAIIAEAGFAALATTSAQVSTNATAGTATLPTGKTELVIYNEKITQNSIIYLTPVGSTNNQVVYLKSKSVSPTPTPESTSSATTPSSFVIALDSPLTSDININWWIIN